MLMPHKPLWFGLVCFFSDASREPGWLSLGRRYVLQRDQPSRVDWLRPYEKGTIGHTYILKKGCLSFWKETQSRPYRVDHHRPRKGLLAESQGLGPGAEAASQPRVSLSRPLPATPYLPWTLLC